MITGIADIKIGALIFTRGVTPISWVVRKLLNFKYSHVAIYIGNGRIVESDIGGVQISQVKKYIDSSIYVSEVLIPDMSDAELSMAITEIMSQINDSYDYKLFVGSFISRVMHRPRTLAGLFNCKKAWICSELIAHGLQTAGQIFGMPASQITPKDLYAKYKKEESKNAGK